MAAPRPTSGPMIETRDLRRTFKSRKSTIDAVSGVDLSVGTAEIFGFLGPNGAGKTTTLRMLATLLTPTAGRRPSPARTCGASRTWSASASATSRRAARPIRPRPVAASW